MTDARVAEPIAPFDMPSNQQLGPVAARSAFGRPGAIIGTAFLALLLISFNPFPTDIETFGEGASMSPFKLAGYGALGLFLVYYFISTFRLFTGSRVRDFTVTNLYILLALGIAAVSASWSIAPQSSIVEAGQLFVFLSLMCFYTQLATTPLQAADRVYYACSALLILSIIGCIAMPSRSIHRYGDIGGAVWVNKNLAGSWRGIFFHKNYAGGVLMFVPILAFPRVIYGKLSNRFISLFILLASLGFLVKAKSSTAILSPAVGLVLAVGIFLIVMPTRRFAWFFASIVTAIVAVFPYTVINYLAPRFGFDADGRAHIWSVNFQAWNAHPLNGYGFAAVYSDDTPLRSIDSQEFASRVGSHAHSGLVEMIGQLGWIGVALYLTFIFLFVRSTIAVMAAARGLRETVFSFALLWVVLSAVIRACFEPDFLTSRGNFYIMALLFMAVTSAQPLVRASIFARR